MQCSTVSRGTLVKCFCLFSVVMALTTSQYYFGRINMDQAIVGEIKPEEVDDVIYVYVKSGPTNFNHRLTLRSSFKQCTETLNITGLKYKFVVGASEDGDDDLTDILSEETKLYKDILRYPQIDRYRNICFKTMFTLEQYISRIHSSLALFMDDDVFVNLTILLNLTLEEPIFYGHVLTRSPAIRDNKSKQYVSFGDFPDAIFPSNPTGACILLSSMVAKTFNRTRKEVKLPCVIDDAYLGMLAKKANITAKRLPEVSLGAINRFRPNPNVLCSHTGSKPGRFVF